MSQLAVLLIVFLTLNIAGLMAMFFVHLRCSFSNTRRSIQGEVTIDQPSIELTNARNASICTLVINVMLAVLLASMSIIELVQNHTPLSIVSTIAVVVFTGLNIFLHKYNMS